MAEESSSDDKMESTNHTSDNTNHTNFSDTDRAPKTDSRGEGDSAERITTDKAEGRDCTEDKISKAEGNDCTKSKANVSSRGESTAETMGAGGCKNETKDKVVDKNEQEGDKEQTESAAEAKRTESDRVRRSTGEGDDDGGDRTRNSRSDRSSSSSSESDSETDREDEDDEARQDDSDHDISSDLENEILGRKLPRPKSQVLQEIRARELGYFQRNIKPFCCKFMGSVPMVQRLEKYCELKHHEGCVNTLHFNPSGTLLASGSDDLEIILWDWAHQKSRLIFESGHRSNVFQAKFMPCSGDTTLVSCARDGQVRVAELSTTGVCKETKKIVQHKGSAHKLGLEPDSPVVFMSCGEDAAVFNIDLRESKPTKLMVVKEEDKKVALYTIFVNPSNTNEFIVGGRDHFVRVFDKRRITDADDSGVVKKFCPHHLVDNEEVKANVTCCVYSYDGQEILASYNDEDIYLFDSTHSDGADSIHVYKGHRNNATVKGVNFYGPRSEFIVSGSDCGNIFLWEKESEKIVQYMQGDIGGVVNCLEPHPSLPCLATSGLDHDVKVWLPTRKETTELEGLKKVMMTNRQEREEERKRGPAFEDNAMMRFLMAHLRHRARRQAMEAGELDSDSEDSSDSEDLPTASCATS